MPNSKEHIDTSPEAILEKLNSPNTLVGESVVKSVESGCSISTVSTGVPLLPSVAPTTHQPTLLSFDGFALADPVELLFLLDKKIQSGEIKLHPWQIQFMLDFADSRHSKDTPFQAATQTCNGSGKDKYIIAACAVWLCMRFKDTNCPVTSSSGDQLDKQTSVHIDRLCYAANALFGPIWKIQYRYYELLHKNEDGSPAPSIITLFATDESGKAEGYHPVDAGKRMAIFTGETKSIPSDIIDALSRCHGFTHRVDVSSPGLQAGYFFDVCTSGVPRSEVKDIKEVPPTESIIYKIPYTQCPHISEAEAERMAARLPGGRSNSLFQSSMLAEFGSTDEMVVIPSNLVWNAVKNPPTWEQEVYNTGGFDIADGGAESVISVRNGNKLLKLECSRFPETQDTLDWAEKIFKENGLTNPKSLIFGDYTGMGGPLLKLLRKKGWSNLRFVDSRNAASEKKTYHNRATELFFNLRLLLERKEISLIHDKLLIQQLCTRYYKRTVENVHALLSKQEQRSKGYPSPDRADSVNLCFWNYKSVKVIDDDAPLDKPKDESEKTEKIVPEFDLKEWGYRNSKKFQPEYTPSSDVEDLRDEIEQFNKHQLITKTK
jgi:hypothetical protein